MDQKASALIDLHTADNIKPTENSNTEIIKNEVDPANIPSEPKSAPKKDPAIPINIRFNEPTSADLAPGLGKITKIESKPLVGVEPKPTEQIKSEEPKDKVVVQANSQPSLDKQRTEEFDKKLESVMELSAKDSLYNLYSKALNKSDQKVEDPNQINDLKIFGALEKNLFQNKNLNN